MIAEDARQGGVRPIGHHGFGRVTDVTGTPGEHADLMGLKQCVEDWETTTGLTAHVHAVDLDSGRDIGARADHTVVAASVFKLPVLVEACRQMAEGELEPTGRIELAATDHSVLGPTGIAVFSDPVGLSVRDLCLSMMTVSDNRATDVVMGLVGLDRVNRTMADLGLARTVLEGDCAHLFAALAEDLGLSSMAELEGAMTDPAVLRTRPLDPDRTNRTTPQEITTLLSRIWREDGISALAAAEARRILGLQVWPHRLRSGFPDDAITVSGKTGTLPYIRNEVGVVEYPDGGRYAVGVFLRLAVPDSVLPYADRAIGELAAAAVDDLREA